MKTFCDDPLGKPNPITAVESRSVILSTPALPAPLDGRASMKTFSSSLNHLPRGRCTSSRGGGCNRASVTLFLFYLHVVFPPSVSFVSVLFFPFRCLVVPRLLASPHCSRRRWGGRSLVHPCRRVPCLPQVRPPQHTRTHNNTTTHNLYSPTPSPLHCIFSHSSTALVSLSSIPVDVCPACPRPSTQSSASVRPSVHPHTVPPSFRIETLVASSSLTCAE